MVLESNLIADLSSMNSLLRTCVTTCQDLNQHSSDSNNAVTAEVPPVGVILPSENQISREECKPDEPPKLRGILKSPDKVIDSVKSNEEGDNKSESQARRRKFTQYLSPKGKESDKNETNKDKRVKFDLGEIDDSAEEFNDKIQYADIVEIVEKSSGSQTDSNNFTNNVNTRSRTTACVESPDSSSEVSINDDSIVDDVFGSDQNSEIDEEVLGDIQSSSSSTAAVEKSLVDEEEEEEEEEDDDDHTMIVHDVKEESPVKKCEEAYNSAMQTFNVNSQSLQNNPNPLSNLNLHILRTGSSGSCRTFRKQFKGIYKSKYKAPEIQELNSSDKEFVHPSSDESDSPAPLPTPPADLESDDSKEKVDTSNYSDSSEIARYPFNDSDSDRRESEDLIISDSDSDHSIQIKCKFDSMNCEATRSNSLIAPDGIVLPPSEVKFETGSSFEERSNSSCGCENMSRRSNLQTFKKKITNSSTSHSDALKDEQIADFNELRQILIEFRNILCSKEFGNYLSEPNIELNFRSRIANTLDRFLKCLGIVGLSLITYLLIILIFSPTFNTLLDIKLDYVGRGGVV